ncbi:MAG TPA: flagellar hook-associated protein FlgK [Rhodothermales bacterium]|nr:flagellar hook-associated protein FlgK [Rhodothermales bacterium]
MSLNSLFELSRRSFRALDAAMNVTGQNVANANTEGYSRRRITLAADSPAIGGPQTSIRPAISVGAGVSAVEYERVRDGLLEKASWEAQSTLGYSQEEHRITSALESLFPASGGGSLSALLGNFWDSWSTLANNPTDDGVRLTVRSSAEALSGALNQLDAQITGLEQQTTTELSSGLDRTNDLLKEIASLNRTIQTARAQGTPDLEAEDRRDGAVKELGAFAPVRVNQQGKGGYTVSINGMTVVQADEWVSLDLDTSGATPQVVFSGTGVSYRANDPSSGQIGAWLSMLSDTLPDTRTQLDTLARGLVTDVNALHAVPYDEDGNAQAAAPNFFYYTDDGSGNEDGVTAATIRISDDVETDPSIIGTPGSFTATGDEIAFAISELRGNGLTGLGGNTAESFAIDLVSGIGARVQKASARATSQQAVTDHLDGLAKGKSGVSLEEEMTNLIRYQQAFAASARVLNTVDEMMSTLLSI